MDAIIKHLPYAYGLKAADEMELPPSLHPAKLLALHSLDIDWLPEYPADEDWLGESIRLTHGEKARAGRGATTKANVEAYDVSTVVGHIHKMETASRTRHLRGKIETLHSYSIGCTCRIDGEVPSKSNYSDWQQSAGLLQYTPDAHSFQHIPVTTSTPKEAIVDENLFTARDRIPDLKKDIPSYPW